MATTTTTAPRAGTVKFVLEFPVEYKGALLKELTVRRPKGRDMRFLPAEASVESMFPFFALVTGVEEGVFDEMDALDIAALGELVTSFLSNGKKPPRR